MSILMVIVCLLGAFVGTHPSAPAALVATPVASVIAAPTPSSPLASPTISISSPSLGRCAPAPHIVRDLTVPFGAELPRGSCAGSAHD